MLMNFKLIFVSTMAISTTVSALTYTASEIVKQEHTYGTIAVSECSSSLFPDDKILIFGDERESFIKFVETRSDHYRIKVYNGNVKVVDFNNEPVSITCLEVAKIKE